MTDSSRVQPGRNQRLLLMVSAVVALVMGWLSPTLMYVLFVTAWFWRRNRPFKGKATRARFGLIVLAMGLLLEFLSWLLNYAQHAVDPPLFHPQLIPDLLIGIGFYAGWSLAWLLLLRGFRFSLLQIVVVMGIYGILAEQNGAVFVTGLAAFPLGLYLWLYVAIAYGGTVGLAFVLSGGSAIPMGQRDHWIKLVIVVVLLYVMTHLTFWVWGALMQGIGAIPPHVLHQATGF